MSLTGLKEYLQLLYTPDTTEAYKREIEVYLSNYTKAERAVYKDLVDYIGVLRNRYPNPRTLNRILSSIKAYYDFLCYSGKRKDNPARSIYLKDKISRDIQLQDLFTTEELETLTNRKERFNKLEYRNKVLISLMIYQALHPRELEALTMNDINLQEGTVYIKPTVKTNARELQLKPNQIMLFYHYINEIRPKLQKESNTAAFILGERGNAMTGEDITKHIKRSFKNRFPGRKVNAQTIRQSVITNLLKQGHDLRIVQTFAGHKYPSTTERYKQNDVEAMKSLLERHHPIK